MFSFFSKDINCICDSHFHLADISKFYDLKASLYSDKKFSREDFKILENEVCYKVCSCAHKKEEYLLQKSTIDSLKDKYSGTNSVFLNSYGLHPQMEESLTDENLEFFESLLVNKEISVAGEIGLDFYSEELKSFSQKQLQYFEKSLELAVKYGVPVVIHCRKAYEQILTFKSLLKRCSSVIFHSYSGDINFASSILKNGINGYFSFGKVLLLNSPKYIRTMQLLPVERILLETDAPFMCSKDEEFTSPDEILNVYKKAGEILSLADFDLCFKISENFNSAFLLASV